MDKVLEMIWGAVFSILNLWPWMIVAACAIAVWKDYLSWM